MSKSVVPVHSDTTQLNSASSGVEFGFSFHSAQLLRQVTDSRIIQLSGGASNF